MINNRGWLNKFKEIRFDIKQMKSIDELIRYIPSSFINTIAFLILILWIMSPLLVAVNSIVLFNRVEDLSYFMRIVELDTKWYVLLQQLGFFGFAIFMLILTKFYKNIIDNKISFRDCFRSHQVEIFLLLLFIWSVISTLFSKDRSLSFNGTLERHDGLISYVAYLGIFVCGYLMNFESDYKKILKVFVWSSTVLSFLMLINIESLNYIFTFRSNSATFYNINHFGYYLSMAVMCSIALYLIEKSSTRKKYTYLLAYIILLAALVKNNSFGPYLAVFTGILFLGTIIFYTHKEYLKDLKVFFVLFCSVSIFMNIIYGNIGHDILSLFKDINEIAKRTNLADDAGSKRWILWKNAIKYISEKPLFGYGPENLGSRYLLDKIQQDRPHNEFIQIGASLGIPALVFYVKALSKHFSLVIKNIKTVSISIIALNAVIFTYLMSSLFGNTMFYTSPFYFMILGMGVSSIKISNNLN